MEQGEGDSLVTAFARATDAVAAAVEAQLATGAGGMADGGAAAARVRVLSPEGIRAGLDDRFRLLTGGSKQDGARHQMTGLVDKSLVVADDDGAGGVRYRLLETIRQFAATHLAAAGETEAVRNLALALQLRTAADAHAMFMADDDFTTRQAADHDNPALAGALADLTVTLLDLAQGRVDDAAAVLESVLGEPRATGPTREDPMLTGCWGRVLFARAAPTRL